MAVPGPPLSEQDARKYFIDVVLGIEYCKSRSKITLNKMLIN